MNSGDVWLLPEICYDMQAVFEIYCAERSASQIIQEKPKTPKQKPQNLMSRVRLSYRVDLHLGIPDLDKLSNLNF